ncbi:ABC transporter ATP-binding protein [bacterium (Candidatus Howlettbacteria) CG_4_10_14_0_8_um_filter_40_9]|nr:MAG: ABC transporter ATP-binding protein [bacterium (Candidatus Howlettbacteria) CG_4_10_14_0_8_um_filter_40_9]
MAKIPVIKTVNLTRTYMLGKIEVDALTNINLEIYSGEFILFFGPSGCGKSTLMSLIAGLQKPSSGKVLVRGEDLATLDADGLAKYRRSKIGMVFQNFNLITSMNVIENIALPLSFAQISKKQRVQRAENLLEVVGLKEYKHHTPSELSGGQQQRIAIARSLVTNPWIMLADEPTGNLDSKSSNEVMRLLISLNRKSKRTVILITHNPDYVEYADRVFYMRDGKILKIKVNPKTKSKKSMEDEDIKTLEKVPEKAIEKYEDIDEGNVETTTDEKDIATETDKEDIAETEKSEDTKTDNPKKDKEAVK